MKKKQKKEMKPEQVFKSSGTANDDTTAAAVSSSLPQKQKYDGGKGASVFNKYKKQSVRSFLY